MIATAEGRGTQLQFKMVCGATLFSPSVRGRAAEGGRGSLKGHLESVYRLCPAPRLEDNFMHATQSVEASNRFLGAKFVRSNHAFHNLSTR